MSEGSSTPEQSTKGLRSFIERAKAIRAVRNRGNKDAVLRAKIELDQENAQQAEEAHRKTLEHAQSETMRDHLTGLHNTKWFEEELNRRMAEAVRQGKGLWVLYVDIDLFKGINDKYGHPVGDKVLKAFGEIGSREEEPIARIGGEEFAQVVTDGLDFQSIQKIISRYSLNFKDRSTEILGREATLSFGVARMQDGDTPESIRSRADSALYYSKQKGRDRATLFEGETDSGNYKDVSLLPREALAPLPQPVSV